jgi:Leucine-rich repeat (LRR) protein
VQAPLREHQMAHLKENQEAYMQEHQLAHLKENQEAYMQEHQLAIRLLLVVQVVLHYLEVEEQYHPLAVHWLRHWKKDTLPLLLRAGKLRSTN